MVLNLFDTWPQFKRSFRSKLENTLSMISSGNLASFKTLTALFMITAIPKEFDKELPIPEKVKNVYLVGALEFVLLPKSK